ncbi:VOC family protein [Plasticicumulans acidivorans]|uniref:VOC domain-containing protein n=1 Tax=Plasticicumulans acidivorans TaxID=886464 RepID=A0A317MRU1_9GAMM|nr:VOC family protein [Plasticicumulans acidivorans]PWV59532.1 hypothetical protein C7443_11077 [Plasticicumulans acidivorans]
MQKIINWFEIPVADLEAAATFYETVLGCTLKRMQSSGMTLAVFPYECPATGGALVQQADAQPGHGGPLLYLDAGPSLAAVLARVEGAGGRILTPATQLDGDIGSIAVIEDVAGQRIGLHAAP